MAVGDRIQAMPGRWSFAGDVSETFSAHIAKSVPLYHEGHDLIARMSDYFVLDGSVCYDLGCSNGDLTIKLADYNQGKKARFIGIDSIPEMIETANSRKMNRGGLSFECDDILQFEYEPADLVTSYYTVQFVRPKVRQELINKIFQSLNWGGAFFMFEKVRAPDARFQDIATTTYFEYKKQQSYSSEEILDKALSLKGILDPFSTAANIEMLQRAGFRDIVSILKWVCFEGFLAIK